MHVMHDIETLGTTPGSIILSIGAVAFDPRAGLFSEFYINIDREVSMDMGLTADQSTIDWWSGQSEEAKAALLVDPAHPKDAFQRYFDWFKSVDGVEVWSHGATFDTPLIEAVARHFRMPCPWKFWNARDTRTLYDIAGVAPDRSAGTHHNALDDARNQASAVMDAYDKINVGAI